MARPIRFLHAADLHLGLRLTRFEENAAGRIAEARFMALEKIQKEAQRISADFVLIAGDLFDDNSVDAKLSARTLAILEGSGWPGPVYVIPGNHDPLTPGCVWDRDPWTREQPLKRLRLLRIAEPVAVPGLPVTLYPCPLRHRVGLDDPTAWISNHPRTSKDEFRIGIAHGSLHVLPQLPEDDHLIAADAAERLDLDYLALGHWHKPFFHGLRTAYPGTHEPMRFPDETSAESSGWQAYGPDKNADRFQDAGQGSALQVELSEPTAAPRIQQVYVSQLTWRHEHLNITDRPPGQVIKEFTSRANVDSTLLHLRLSGVVNPQELRRFDELRELVINRFAPGSRYEADEVLVEADGEELRAVVGDGVLRRVFERLQEDAHDPARMAVARRALKLLYQLAWEDRPA